MVPVGERDRKESEKYTPDSQETKRSFRAGGSKVWSYFQLRVLLKRERKNSERKNNLLG